LATTYKDTSYSFLVAEHTHTHMAMKKLQYE